MGEEKSAMIIIICGIIGIVFAIMFQMMNSDQLIINELISGTITLRVVQAFVILFWIVVGVILAVATR